MEGVTPGMVVGVTTEAIAAEGMIVTAGGIDSPYSFYLPSTNLQFPCSWHHYFDGGGTGPATGTKNYTPAHFGAKHIELMLKATDVFL